MNSITLSFANLLAETAARDYFAFGTLVLAFLFLALAIRANRRKRLIDDTPTSKTKGIAIGFTEVKGSAESTEPLTSYLGEIDCVYYSFEVRERYSRTETDSDGKTSTKTGWKTVLEDTRCQNFYLKDDTGEVLVCPVGAEMKVKTTFSEKCGRHSELYYAKGPATAICDSDYVRKFVEKTIPIHENCYVLGQAKIRKDIVAPKIAKSKNAPIYMISTKSEEELSSGYSILFWVFMLLGLAGAATGGSLLAMTFGTPEKATPYGVGATAIYLFLLFSSWSWMVYNSLVSLKHRLKQGCSNIDVQLKRRHDLIPQIVRVIKGYQKHEQETLELVSFLRSQSQATIPGQQGNDPEACLPTLKALQENYPELKANEQFKKLQSELINTEQMIALSREFYNEIVGYYNKRLGIFPDSFVAKILGLKRMNFFEIQSFERAVVKVKFKD